MRHLHFPKNRYMAANASPRSAGASGTTPPPVTRPPLKIRMDAAHPRRRRPSSSDGGRWSRDEPPMDWLKLQAGDLIERLNVWADDLQRREANLAVGEAKLEQRARQFRLAAQQTRLELEALRRRLDARQQQLESNHKQCSRLARQLAMAQFDDRSAGGIRAV